MQRDFPVSQEAFLVLHSVFARLPTAAFALLEGFSCCVDAVAEGPEVFAEGAKSTGASAIIFGAAPVVFSVSQAVSAASQGAVGGVSGETLVTPFARRICRYAVA